MAYVAHLFRRQAEYCRTVSPLYAELLTRLADDLVAGGVTAEVLTGHERDTEGSALPLRLTGALHRLVLAGQAPELARFFPSVGGSEPPTAVWPAAERVLRAHRVKIHDLLDRPVQTNEVARCAVLLGGLLVAAARHPLPIRLLEVGASAGLNLRVDRYRYEVSDAVLGDPHSPVRLVQPWEQGSWWPPIDAPLRVVERRGCDPAPLDPGFAEDRLTLTSYVWPDQTDRLRRLDAALQVAAAVPVVIDRAGAGDWLADQLSRPAVGRLTVVWHSVVWQYLATDEREVAEATIAAAGERARTNAPLAHLALEPREVDGRFVFEVRMTSWPGGESRLLATATGHGPPVRWAARA